MRQLEANNVCVCVVAAFLVLCVVIVLFCTLSFIIIFRTATSSDASDAGFSVDGSAVQPFITTFNMVRSSPTQRLNGSVPEVAK